MWKRRRKDDGAHQRRAMEVFLAVCDETPEGRRAVLDRTCGDDADLRATVEEMLAADARPDLPGEALAPRSDVEPRLGPYRLVSEIGAGAMGIVYLGEVVEERAGLSPGSRVAVKVVHPHLLGTPGVVERFVREARLGQQVSHENVVRTYDCDIAVLAERPQHFLVMEYVEGQTLRDALRELERLPEALCRHVARKIALGLEAIHAAHVVHRDLKPENVLLTKEHAVKIMDLGIARLRDESTRLSVVGQFLGTVEYAAPEQLRDGAGELDGRADLYAMGVLLYELSTGARPFAASDARALFRKVLEEPPRRCGEANPQLTPFFEEVVHTLLAKRAEERFASATELLEILDQGEESSWWKRRSQLLRRVTRRPLRRVRVPRDAALQGREAEGETLRALYARASAGEGQVLLVEGEPGIGKSRLVDEFVALLRDRGEDPNFLFGSFPAGGAATAYAAFVTALREHFGDADLPASLAVHLRATPSLVPAFAALLRGETTPAGTEPLTKDAIHTLFVNVTRSLAEERPTIVFVDDLQFAPEEGRGLFAALALAVREHRVLLIGSTRPGVSEDWIAEVTGRGQGARLALSRLGPRDLLAMLTECFGSARLAEELGMRIAVKSDGNPFFVLEIVRSLKESPLLRRGPDGTWIATQAIRDIEIPSGVLDLIRARLRDLTEEERDLLETASCLGYEFDPGVLAAVLGEPRLSVLRRCGRVEQKRHLLRAAGRFYAFDHHQVQEAIYQGLHEQLREEYHATIAETLAAAATPSADALRGAAALEVCQHAFRGGRGALALRHLDAALAHAEACYDDAGELALTESALATSELRDPGVRARVLLRRYGPLGRAGRLEESTAELLEAAELAQAAGDGALQREVLAARASGLARLGRTAEAEAALGALLAPSAAGGEDLATLQALLALGMLRLTQGKPVEAEGKHRAARDLAVRLGRRGDEVQATTELGRTLVFQARYEDGRREIERALTIAQESRDRRGASRATLHLGLAAVALGHHEEAAARYEEFLRSERELGHRLGEVTARINLGNLRAMQGRYADCDALYEPVLRMARETGMRETEAVVLFNLGAHRARYGDASASRTHFHACLAVCREISARRVEGYALDGLGTVAELEGDAAEAESCYERALAVRREIGYRGGVATTLGLLGALHGAAGRTEQARSEFEEARVLAREQGTPAGGVLSACHLASLGAFDPEAAAEELSRDEARIPHGDRMTAHFVLWKAGGDPRHLEAAHTLLTFGVAHASEDRRDSMTRLVPLHRAILAAWAARRA